MAIRLVSSAEAYKQALTEFDNDALTAVFMPLKDPETLKLADTLKIHGQEHGDERVDSAQIPKTVQALAQLAMSRSPDKLGVAKKLIKNPPIFGASKPITGLHTDNKELSEAGKLGIGLIGTWYLISGSARLLLKPAESYISEQISDEIERLTDFVKFDFGSANVIKGDKRSEFEQIELTGPHVGAWALGMSPARGIHTTLHQVETIGDQPRYSTNLFPYLFQLL